MTTLAVSSVHAGTTATEARNPRLTAAAHEFEASLMKEFLKPLEHDSLSSDDKQEESDGEGSAGAIMSFGSQAMATAISERGGFGIATIILNRLDATSSTVHSAHNPGRRLSATAAGRPGAKAPSPAADEGT